MLLILHHRKKYKRNNESSNLRESRSWQVYVSKACGKLNFGRKVLLPNIVIPSPLQIPKKKILEKLYITQKIPHECFETHGQGRLWPFSVGCFKSYSGVVAFLIFTGKSIVPREQS